MTISKCLHLGIFERMSESAPIRDEKRALPEQWNRPSTPCSAYEEACEGTESPPRLYSSFGQDRGEASVS